ncbi:PP2C family protein-serine/threonine phosphatase [Aquabacter cavernae]|uniref:PP2C family protein-serine/threonine phosphatase n=1 Tax=Aquabacter cavernae TaxID=2496029 RepID=UPI000F8C8675|nr:PP2C family serine/threonine-protein phosphatase [Aquabacter cavernae]
MMSATSALHPHASAATRTGPLHVQNEDAHLKLPEAGLYVVADGIGGLADGAVASRVVVEMLTRMVVPGDSLDTRVQQARDAISRANTALFLAGREAQAAMGTTVVVVLVGEDCAVCLWAGDSRGYLMRQGQLHRVTTDHAIFARISDELPPRSMVTRAVGPDESVDLDCVVFDLEVGDSLFLCTDGVCGSVPEERLEALLDLGVPVTADHLVAEAVTRGTRDDATAVVIRMCGEEATHVTHG